VGLKENGRMSGNTHHFREPVDGPLKVMQAILNDHDIECIVVQGERFGIQDQATQSWISPQRLCDPDGRNIRNRDAPKAGVGDHGSLETFTGTKHEKACFTGQLTSIYRSQPPQTLAKTPSS
jgi:hypothetical protein